MILKRAIFNKIKESLSTEKVEILIGHRQVGKTFLMRQLFDSLPETEQKLFLLGDDSSLNVYFDNLTGFETFLRSKSIDTTKKVYIFIDEFHYLKDISKKIKWFFDANSNFKFILSGSNNLSVSKNLSESMAGRTNSYRVNPLSFSEYLENFYPELYLYYLNVNLNESNIDFITPDTFKTAFNEFLILGSFPEILISGEEGKIIRLKSIVDNYIKKDIKGFIADIDDEKFNILLELLANQIGSLLSLNNIANITGESLFKTKNNVNLLIELFTIFKIYPFSSQLTKEIIKAPKIYYEDNGIRNYLISNFSTSTTRHDRGFLVENFVVLEFRKLSDLLLKINYWRTKQGTEIDFILRKNESLALVEVKSKELTSFPEFKSFDSFSSIYGEPQFTVVLHGGNQIKKYKDKLLLPVYFASKIIEVM